MATFGYETAGAAPLTDYHDCKIVGKYTLTEEGDVSKLTARLANTGASHAACNVKAVIYSNNPDGTADALEATGTAVALADNAAAAWVDLPFSADVSLAAGDYFIGLHGDANAIGLVFYATTTGGTMRTNYDVYSSGASDPFGAPDSGTDVRMMSVYGTYTPTGVAGATVTKYATAVTNVNWSNTSVAALNADDDVVAYGYAGQTMYASDFDFAIPTDATLTELSVIGEYESWNLAITMQPQTGSGGYRGVPAYGPATGTNDDFIITGTATLLSSGIEQLPTIAELNDSTFCVKSTLSGLYGALRLDYLKLTATYAYLATVTTDAVTAITASTATCGGETTDDGSGTISACGVCWSLSASPTIADDFTSDDSGIGTYVSALTGLWSSCTYHVRAWATTEDGTVYGNEVVFSTAGAGGRSLVARPFTTRAAAAESVARTGSSLIDWWIADGVARAEVRPTLVAEVPRTRWYVVSRDAANATVSVTLDSEDTPDVVCVVYRAYGVTNTRDGTVLRVYSPATPTSAVERVQLVDLSGQYMGSAEATSYAENVLARVAADVMTATITATGGLYTVDGLFRAAPLICAGDWIDVVDLPGHVPTYITGTTYSMAEHTVTITTGGREQRELIVPGMSALPGASTLTVFGQQETSPASDPYSAYDEDPYLEEESQEESELDETEVDPNYDLRGTRHHEGYLDIRRGTPTRTDDFRDSGLAGGGRQPSPPKPIIRHPR